MVDADAARPLLTWYDDATGERVELSGATLANWVAKTANLLVDDAAVEAGDRATVDAPPHWQTAAVLLGCWCAGLAVVSADVDADVVFAAADRIARHAGELAPVYGLALAPLAAPMREVPAGVTDFVSEVRGHGDHFAPLRPIDPADSATDTMTHRELCTAAGQRAEALGIHPGARVLISAGSYPDPLDWLLAPLVVGASVVLCGHLAVDSLPSRIEAERVTHTLT